MAGEAAGSGVGCERARGGAGDPAKKKANQQPGGAVLAA